MIYACRYGTRIDLAAWIADEIAHCAGCPSYLADPVVTDELRDLARISGIPELPRISIFHALNSRAVSRSYAARIGRKYEELNLIVAHLEEASRSVPIIMER